jgi:hypothetical protein
MSAVFQRWSIELLAFEPDFLARLVEAAGIRAIVSKSDPLSLANVEFNVFLAYNSADLNMARKLYRTLKKRKLRPWFDQAELLPGDRWMRHIGAAISSVRCAAILFGTAGLGSWQRGEVDACIDACFARDLKVIPILLPGDPELSELPELIRGNQVSDLRAGFTAHVLDHLTYAIRSAVDKSPQY